MLYWDGIRKNKINDQLGLNLTGLNKYIHIIRPYENKIK